MDDEDFEFLRQFKWHLANGYAARKPSAKTIFLHKIVNSTPDGFMTDHINGNKLDNRKENLRNCSRSQNAANSKKRSCKNSRYKGLYHHNGVSWKVQISKKYIGLFSDDHVGSLAYDLWATALFGKFAKTNNKVVAYGP